MQNASTYGTVLQATNQRSGFFYSVLGNSYLVIVWGRNHGIIFYQPHIINHYISFSQICHHIWWCGFESSSYDFVEQLMVIIESRHKIIFHYFWMIVQVFIRLIMRILVVMQQSSHGSKFHQLQLSSWWFQTCKNMCTKTFFKGKMPIMQHGLTPTMVESIPIVPQQMDPYMIIEVMQRYFSIQFRHLVWPMYKTSYFEWVEKMISLSSDFETPLFHIFLERKWHLFPLNMLTDLLLNMAEWILYVAIFSFVIDRGSRQLIFFFVVWFSGKLGRHRNMLPWEVL